jgi:hypothetical protein
MSTLDECPRKFLYRDRLGIRPVGYQSALSLGSMFHKALQSYFLGGTAADRAQALDKMSQDYTNELTTRANPVGLLPDGTDVLTVTREIDEDRYKALAMAETFIHFHPFDLDKWEILHSAPGVPVVELLLEAQVPGITQPIRSPCDLALVKKGTNEVWIVDHKTTSMAPKVRAAALSISTQARLYRLVLQHNLAAWAGISVDRSLTEGGLQVVGAIHNIIKKPTIKYCPDTKDKGGFHKYVERMVEWYKTNEDTMLQTFDRFTGPVLDNELGQRLTRIDQAVSWDATTGRQLGREPLDVFYRAGDYVCHTFNRPCPYLTLCSSSPSMWADLIKSQYKIEFRDDADEAVYRRDE